jgi:hypothetical protein
MATRESTILLEQHKTLTGVLVGAEVIEGDGTPVTVRSTSARVTATASLRAEAQRRRSVGFLIQKIKRFSGGSPQEMSMKRYIDNDWETQTLRRYMSEQLELQDRYVDVYKETYGA